MTLSLVSGLLALFVTGGGLRDVGTALSVAAVYGLPILALESLTEKSLRQRANAVQFPLDWIVYAGAKLVLGCVAVAAGSAMVLLLGIIGRWQDLYLANRTVVVVWVIASCLIRLYGNTRSRLEERNRLLEMRVESEGRALRLHEQDSELAREIQQGLMPKCLPEVDGCQFAATCQSARSVGGDYYDAIPVGDTSIVLVIGDVSGKGMAAALLMSNLQAIVRAFAPSGITPADLCTKANRLIAGNVAPGKYITFFYAVADIQNRRIEYCNAGHNPAILKHCDGTVEMLGEGGPVLGVFPDARYAGETAEFRAGDCLVLFTDGISEAMSAEDEEFGDTRLLQSLNRGSESRAEQCRDAIMSAVREFSGGVFHDDATVLVMTLD